ncbi:adenylate kinase [Conexibacter sp. DBS9H8]|uniref:adenylate kinase n=1 Tax=Conexibacter sp. DBS9H8 TaxID=2937801 RepID=UPI003530A4B1
MNLILIGPPGAGKGTQADKLRDDFKLPYVATGEIFRAHVQNETELGREVKAIMADGGLVPDELVLELVASRLDEDDVQDGFILDGFPRTIPQAEALSERLESEGRHLTAALLIDVPDEEVIKRISGRRVCVKAEHLYHVDYDPPKNDGVCDQDGSRLIQRDDDRPEVVRNRLAEYHDNTEPLIAYYDEQGILRRVDGTRPPVAVHDHIRAVIATLKLEDNV